MNSLAEEIIAGRRLGSREEALPLVEAELEALCRGADRIRSALCGSRADPVHHCQRAQRPVRRGLQILRPVLPLPHPGGGIPLPGGR